MDWKISNRWLLAVTLCVPIVIGCFACLMATARPAQAATAQNITVVSKHSKALVASSHSKTIKSYDVTGDKKKDKLTVKMSHGKTSWKAILRIYVNGKKAKTLSIFAPPTFTPEVYMKYLCTSSKRPFLYISFTGIDQDGIYGVYRYKSGKLVKVVGPTSAIAQKYGTGMYLKSAKASGKKIAVRFCSMTRTIGVMNYTYSYMYKSGKLVRTSATASKLSSFKGVSLKNQPLAFTTKIYKAAGSGKVAYTAKAGTKLTISKVKTLKGQPWFYVKNAKGQKGWIKGIDRGVCERHDVETLFKNAPVAG